MHETMYSIGGLAFGTIEAAERHLAVKERDYQNTILALGALAREIERMHSEIAEAKRKRPLSHILPPGSIVKTSLGGLYRLNKNRSWSYIPADGGDSRRPTISDPDPYDPEVIFEGAK